MGYIVIVLSSLLFGIVPTVQNLALKNGADASAVVAYCHIASVIAAYIGCKVRHISLKLSKKEVVVIIVAAFALFVTDFCLSTSYSMIPVGMTTMIHFSYPTIVCIVNSLMFKEKFTIKKAISIALSICGLILLTGGGLSGSVVGIIFALVSAMAYGSYVLINDKSAAGQINESAKTFYFYLVCAIIGIITCCVKKVPLNFQFNHFSYCIVAGLMLELGMLFATTGISLIGSSKASLFSTLEPVTSMIVSTIVNHYELLPKSIIGCVLIVGSLIPNAIKDKEEQNG